MNANWKTDLLKKLLLSNEIIDCCTPSIEQLGSVCKELGISGQELVLTLSGILIGMYRQSKVFNGCTDLKEILRIILNQDSVKFSQSEVNQAASSLGLSEEQLCEKAIGVLIMQYISSVDLLSEIEQLKSDKRDLEVRNHILVEKAGARVTQPELMKQGALPLAYKPKATIDQIRRLKAAGFSTEEIASSLGVSRATVWRRIKEAEQQSKTSSTIW